MQPIHLYIICNRYISLANKNCCCCLFNSFCLSVGTDISLKWSWGTHAAALHDQQERSKKLNWETNLSNVASCRKVDTRLFPSRTRSTGSEILASSKNVGNKSIRQQTWLETWIKHYRQLYHSAHGSGALY